MLKKKTAKGLIVVQYLFLFGWMFYLILPVLLSNYYMDMNLPLSKYVGTLLYGFSYFSYYSYCFLLLFFFNIGLYLFFFIFRTNVQHDLESSYYTNYMKSSIMMLGILLIIFSFLLFNYYQLRNSLFKGYSGLNWNERNDAKSLISGFNIVMTVITVYLYHISTKLKYFSSLILLLNSVILLGLGGRMYVLIPLVSILVYLLVYVEVSVKKVSLYALASLALLLIMGLIRQGEKISSDGMFFILMAEPMFNWLSTGSILKYNSIGLFEIPYGLVGSIVSMVPTIFWKGKYVFLSGLETNNFLIESPVGGTNIIATLLSNFGFIGAIVTIFILGGVAGFLAAKCRKGPILFSFFCIFCAVLPFMFFRDGISIFQKNLLVNGFFVPWIIIIFDKVFIALTRK